jgi:hypothetical protein
MNRKQVAALTAILIFGTGTAAMALRGNPNEVTAKLNADPAAANAGLQSASGAAFLREHQGLVHILVDLGGAELPVGTVLEGWVVDAGLLGGPGTTSVSDDDEVYGPPFGNPDFDEMVDNAPYALSTGILEKRGNHYGVTFHINNNLTPYDAVVVTLESDGNGMNYDPRPGSIVVAGPIVR